MEQHQELMDKFIAERQAEADDLRMQHEKDIAECRKTIIEEYDAKINELEQNQESEIVRLKEEMAKIVPAVADESPVLESQEPVDKPDQDGGSTEGGDDLPSDPEVVKQRSSAEMDDSIEDLRETHTAIIARIEAEYEEKLKRIKEGNLFYFSYFYALIISGHVAYMPTPERSKEGHDPLSTKKKRVITRNDVFGL